jgi:dimethylaniline monooxygenase (N-oxide forming)
MSQLPKVCVIGAGSSGITIIKSLQDKGIPFDCYEKGSDVGGNWRYKNDNGMSNIYKSLHINTHRDRMEYRDFPMPESYPDYPNHTPIYEYFKDYVDNFGLREKIQFRNGVVNAEFTEDGVWKVQTERTGIHFYDALIVANGHHWSPRWPTPAFQGKFAGKEMHAHDYISPSEPINLIGKNVVILGMGNSAMDISVELSRPGIANKVYLAARRGAYVIPNYLFGKPLDKLTEKIPPWVPMPIAQFFANLLIRYGVGKMEDFGLPKPDHKFGSAHPTISQDLLVRLGRGDINPKPNIESYNGKSVNFTDGSSVDADVVIYCTGYDVKFPFFEESFLSAKENYLPLFFRMVQPERNNLFFVGLMQPLGAVMPLAEFQGKWISEYLTGQYQFPTKKEMQNWIQDDEDTMKRRYVNSARHTMQVDFDVFLWKMKRELKKGKARSTGNLPIEAKAYQFASQAVKTSKGTKTKSVSSNKSLSKTSSKGKSLAGKRKTKV